jgi:hypothetical protein
VQDHGDAPGGFVGFQLLENLKAAFIGHGEIEQNQSGQVEAGPFGRLGTRGFNDLVRRSPK